MSNDSFGTGRYLLVCERPWLYHVLTAVAGFFGAFTYLLRGNIFCNAQTGNVVLMGLALGQGNWRHAGYYLIPISAYIAGAFLSELLPPLLHHRLPLRWETLLVLLEMAAVLVLGFLPEEAPVQISQVTINFVASMQYNTFRQTGGFPVATTFATNHIRQIGVGLAHELPFLRTPDRGHRKRLKAHLAMLLYFFGGTVVGTLFCRRLLGRAIWVVLLPLGVVFAALLHADLTTERELLEQPPAGHSFP